MPPHRADIVGRKGTVIELQHSSLSPAEVRARESFYRDMVWVVDGSEFAHNFFLRRKDGPDDGYRSFRWKYPRKWMWSITQPLCLDFGGTGLFVVRKMSHGTPCGGYGTIVDRDWFIARWLTGVKSCV